MQHDDTHGQTCDPDASDDWSQLSKEEYHDLMASMEKALSELLAEEESTAREEGLSLRSLFHSLPYRDTTGMLLSVRVAFSPQNPNVVEQDLADMFLQSLEIKDGEFDLPSNDEDYMDGETNPQGAKI